MRPARTSPHERGHRSATCRLLVLLICFSACLPASAVCSQAQASQSVSLGVTLTREPPGTTATVGLSFKIRTPVGQLPSPLTEVDVRYPRGLALTLSELGQATCAPALLNAAGPKGCPSNSLMGDGTAVAELPIGPRSILETAKLTIVRAPNQDGHLALLFDVDGSTPVIAHLLFPALLLPAAAPFGGDIRAGLPLFSSLPGGPDVAVVQLHSLLGSPELVYHEVVKGHVVAYHPRGIPLPSHCRRGGFQFTASFGFQDGSHASARTTVPCPAHRPRKR